MMRRARTRSSDLPPPPSLSLLLLPALLLLSWAAVLALAVAPQAARADAPEIETLTARLLAPPEVHVEPGFAARLLVPPGELYDPLSMLPHGDAVWVNDDGGEEGDKGSRLLSVDRRGKVSVVVGLGKLLPAIGFDVAPPSFAPYAGEIFTLAQARAGLEGALANHVIQRVDPRRGFAASVFCTLPYSRSISIRVPRSTPPGVPVWIIGWRWKYPPASCTGLSGLVMTVPLCDLPPGNWNGSQA